MEGNGRFKVMWYKKSFAACWYFGKRVKLRHVKVEELNAGTKS
jgi:hypothetical protein